VRKLNWVAFFLGFMYGVGVGGLVSSILYFLIGYEKERLKNEKDID